MHIDAPSVVGAVVRSVETRLQNGREARVVIAARDYDTDIDDLWDALTSKERIPRWFAPVSGELRLGGQYQVQGNAGGTITKCEPPREFGWTWEFAGAVSWVEVRLESVSTDRTRLHLEHIAYPDKHWEQFGPGATGVGWDLGLAGLAIHLETGASNDPKEAMAWLGSANGKEFVRQSSDDWGRAAMASGDDEATAKGAAARTFAAYTGADDGSTREHDATA